MHHWKSQEAFFFYKLIDHSLTFVHKDTRVLVQGVTTILKPTIYFHKLQRDTMIKPRGVKRCSIA